MVLSRSLKGDHRAASSYSGRSTARCPRLFAGQSSVCCIVVHDFVILARESMYMCDTR